MKSGPQSHSLEGLWGPSSIMVVSREPLMEAPLTLHPKPLTPKPYEALITVINVRMCQSFGRSSSGLRLPYPMLPGTLLLGP